MPDRNKEFDIAAHFSSFTEAMRGGFPFLASDLSDPAAVVMATALIDQSLQFALTVGFYRGAVSKTLMAKVFEGNGPLSTFSSKIDLSYIQGLTSKSQHHDLQVLRRIRNEFAHSTKSMRLADFPACDNLKVTAALDVQREHSRQTKFLLSSAGLVGEMMLNVIATLAKQKVVAENQTRFAEVFQETLHEIFAIPENPVAKVIAQAKPVAG